jgi:hypothetical protein
MTPQTLRLQEIWPVFSRRLAACQHRHSGAKILYKNPYIPPGPCMPATNSCRLCGATSYRPVVIREGGAMRPSGLYRCSGCSVVFEDPKSWRDGGSDSVMTSRPPGIEPAAPRSVSAPRAPDFNSYGAAPPRTG